MSAESPIVVEPTATEQAASEPTIENTVPADNAPKAADDAAAPKTERTWSEEIEIAGSQLVEQVKSWLAEGNVRRLILRTPDNSIVLEIPLVTGAVVGGVLTIFAPLMAIMGAIASVLAHVKVEIVRVEDPPIQS